MEEKLISFDTSFLAHNKGFTRETIGFSFTSTRRNYYNIEGELNGDCTDFIKDVIKYGREKTKIRHILYPATSQSLLQKWLREEHNIFVTIECQLEDEFTLEFIPKIYDVNNYRITKLTNEYDYEEALEKALYEALSFIKL